MRLDQYLLEKGYVTSRSKATDLIRRKLVTVNGVIAKKPGIDVHDEVIEILEPMIFVSRGGEKLEGAIHRFNVKFRDKIVIDVGASTGGFTHVSLLHGAKHVYAYDVGKNQLVEHLRNDARVSVYEETNFLDVNIPHADIIVIDVSFISVKTILSHIKAFQGVILCLIKPQFEIGPIHMKHGVLKDKNAHKEVLKDVISHAITCGFNVVGIMKSTIKGKKGNQEYMIYIDRHLPKILNIEESVRDLIC